MHRRGEIETKRYDIAVTGVRIACLDREPDSIGADACASVKVRFTQRGKKSKSVGTLVRVQGSWYFAYYGTH
jgi:hypothetical protein